MDFNTILPIAVQLPLVFLFMWYNDRLNSNAQKERVRVDEMHQQERREFLAVLKEITTTLDKLSDEIHNIK